MFNQFHQSLRSSVVGMAFCLLPALAPLPAEAQPATSIPTPAPAVCASPDVVVLEVKGTVRVSADDGKTWTPATAGLRVTRSDSFRTGFRSSVTWGVAPGQTFTLESLSTIRVDAASLGGGHYKTQVMKCGAVTFDPSPGSLKDEINTPVDSEQCGAEQHARSVDEPSGIAGGAGPSHTLALEKGLMWTFFWTVLASLSGYCLRYAKHFSKRQCLHH